MRSKTYLFPLTLYQVRVLFEIMFKERVSDWYQQNRQTAARVVGGVNLGVHLTFSGILTKLCIEFAISDHDLMIKAAVIGTVAAIGAPLSAIRLTDGVLDMIHGRHHWLAVRYGGLRENPWLSEEAITFLNNLPQRSTFGY